MENVLDWLTLYLIPGLGSVGCRRLLACFGSPGQVFAASRKALLQIPGIGEVTATAILNSAPCRDRAQAELHHAAELGVTLLTWADPLYPELLRHIHNPPLILYVKGTVADLQGPCVGVVGSRAATDYGRGVAEKLAADLARRGVTVVSGLALGIDAAAHRGALTAKGRTLGILGCGLDIVYPGQNERLFREIPGAGALVSEFPLGTPPESFNFPARNRIISGLCLGLVVVEATRRSGSLITANLALEQGREVFAIPGRVDSLKSEGTHRLLKDGAKLVHSVDDIMEELFAAVSSGSGVGPSSPGKPTGAGKEFDLTEEEKKVMSVLGVYPLSIDEIIHRSAFAAAKVSEVLLLLELKGAVECLPGKQYKALP